MSPVLAPTLATIVLLVLPAAAAVRWVRRVLPDRATDWPAKLAVAYAGCGVAVLALWLGCSMFGLSPVVAVVSTSAATLMLLIAGRRRPAAGNTRVPGSARTALAVVALLSATLVAVPFLTYGLERGDGIHRMAMTDWEKHLVMATGIAASPEFPPPHPFLHADPDPSYYFGFHLLAAAIQVTSGGRGDLFAILLAITLLTAAATPVVAYAFARDLSSAPAALLAAVCSSVLVGFDLIVVIVQALRNLITSWPLPAGFEGLRALVPSTHIDFWIHNVDRQFSAPLVTTMWAPHQTMAALLALLVLYLLSPARSRQDAAPDTWLLPLLLLGALPAVSAYVVAGLAVGLAAVVGRESLRARSAPWQAPTLRRWLGPGALSAVAALPILATLARGSSSGLVLLTSAAGDWTNGALWSTLFGSRWWTDLLDTPAVYLFDFGIIGLLGALQIRRTRDSRTPAQDQAVAMAMAILVCVVVVRPPQGIGNNLYARALLLPWFLLAPLAADAALRARHRRWAGLGAAVCVLGSLYVLCGYLLEGALFWGADPARVDAVHWINRNLGPTQLVAVEPGRYSLDIGLRLRRPLAFANPRLARLFGASHDQVRRAQELSDQGFGARDPATAARAFDELQATAILLPSAPMPVWALPPCFERAYANSRWLVVRRTGASCELP